MVQAVTAHPLGGHRLVTPRDDGTVEYADATDPDHMNRPIWLTTAAWATGVVADLVAGGLVAEPSWTWTPGVPLLLSTAGLLAHALPPGALFCRRVALVVDADLIWFEPTQPVALA
ncbi:hypothetical protein IU501_34690 [Nocardia otitidiscaviarum]|uniref:hypothetical protein n=1 Tax=Nocardia otitidiscaviarum TaxID=1823 RepID=UPI001894548A|nr:hypothetical protein [Nocardia otitidiscaviarum]MBF6138119.1 hypothetical protein [Nocardia otitidiscaviarum]